MEQTSSRVAREGNPLSMFGKDDEYREGRNAPLVTPPQPQRAWQAGTVRDPLEVRSPRGGVRSGARARMRGGWGQ